MNIKSAKNIIIIVAAIVIVSSIGVNIVFDGVVVTTKDVEATDVWGNKKVYTTFAYAPEYQYPKLISEFLYTLGIAVLVYFLVEHTLSRYDKNKQEKELEDLRRKINQDVFEGVLKKIIPETLFEIVSSDILNKNLLRKNVKWEYEITENKVRGGYDMTQLIIYELCNISNTKTSVPLIISLNQTKDNNSSFNSYEVLKMDGTPIPVVPIDKGTERILNLDFEPGQTVKVIHHVKVEYSNYHVTDCHFSNYSIVGLEIRVRKPADCTFRPIPSFSNNLEVLKEDHCTIIYKPVKGLLKGQALIYLLDKELAKTNDVPVAAADNLQSNGELSKPELIK